MKSYTIYVCETCGKESRNAEEIIKCEAEHLGLTVSEYEEYNRKKDFVRSLSAAVSITNNESTRKKVDDAVDDLIRFEAEHGIKIE